MSHRLLKEQVARFIERSGLKAVILHEQPNGGKTIIEKFEKHGGGAGFAVVIAAPDDVGGLVGEAQRPRARQNVIGEMFWFAGRLGRDRVCELVKGKSICRPILPALATPRWMTTAVGRPNSSVNSKRPVTRTSIGAKLQVRRARTRQPA